MKQCKKPQGLKHWDELFVDKVDCIAHNTQYCSVCRDSVIPGVYQLQHLIPTMKHCPQCLMGEVYHDGTSTSQERCKTTAKKRRKAYWPTTVAYYDK